MSKLIFPEIPGFNLCQLQTYLTPHCLVKISLFTISYKLVLMEMCLVCLMSLPFLNTQIADLLSNITTGACYGITAISLFNNSLFIILKFARAIPAVHDALYSLSALYGETGPGTYAK